MKIRNGFVSNSSSTAFIITNISKEKKTLVDFVNENPHLLYQFLHEYEWHKDDERLTHENLVADARTSNITFNPGESKYCVFGDEQSTQIGLVYDYILRSGGDSPSFNWHFKEYLR